MEINSSHNASGQMAGYLYQVLAALLLLFENKELGAKLCIEKFDDISFFEDDTPKTMIQTKHQISKKGILSDVSTDLWRTINSWCDLIQRNPEGLSGTNYIILTTADNQEDSAPFYLSADNNRNVGEALKILKTTAGASANATNKRYYDRFLSLDEHLQMRLVNHAYVYCNSVNIIDIEKELLKFVRCATLPIYEKNVYEKLIGWWISSIILCLCSEEPIFITREELQIKLFDIGSEYKSDSLPIDVDFDRHPTAVELEELSEEDRIFIEQLKLISISSERIKRCIRDYYNAYRQRSLWVREQLLFVTDLEKYESILVDEWQRLYLIMQEDLLDYGDELNDQVKTRAGRMLFGNVEELNKPIRERVSYPFIMRGTYHGLANQLKVGWHLDFMERLCHLLKG